MIIESTPQVDNYFFQVTPSQKMTALGSLQTSQQQQLTEATQQNQKDLDKIKTQYSASVTTSSSFGYIAGSNF